MNNRRTFLAGNTLVELIIYMALTAIIVVGLSSIVSRLRQAEFIGTVKTDVQQSLRSISQHLSALSLHYQSGTLLSDPTGIALWNVEDNPESGSLKTYKKFWLENGALYLAQYSGGETEDTLRLTPDNISVTELAFEPRSTDTNSPVIGVSIAAQDASSVAYGSASGERRTDASWSIQSAITLRPASLDSPTYCCASYLSFCPQSIPHCPNNGCYQNGANASDVLGQYTREDGVDFPNYTSANQNNGIATNSGGFVNPQDVAIDTKRHRVYVVESVNNRVLMFELNADNSLKDYQADAVIGQEAFVTNNQEALKSPAAIALYEKAGWLFVSDTGNDRVLVYAVRDDIGTDPIFTLEKNIDGDDTDLNAPMGIAIDETKKHLYVADSGNDRILAFDMANLALLGVIDRTGESNPLNNPTDVLLRNDMLFVSDTDNDRVVIFDVQFIESLENVVAQLQLGNVAGNALNQLNGPTGLAYDRSRDRLFVSDSNNHRVLAFSGTTLTSGMNASLILGQSAANLGQPNGGTSVNRSGLHSPAGIAFDSIASRLFIADSTNNRVAIYDGGEPICSGGPAYPPPSVAVASSSQSTSNSSLAPITLACDQPVSGKLFEVINEPPSMDDTAGFIQSCVPSTAFFRISDVPADFATASGVTLRVRYRINEGLAAGANNFGGFSVRIVKSNGTTPLTEGISVSSSFDTDWKTAEFTVDALPQTGDNKAFWDNALLKVENLSLEGAIPKMKISAIEMDLRYFNGSAYTNPPDPLRPNGDYDTDGWSRVGGTAAGFCAPTAVWALGDVEFGEPNGATETTLAEKGGDEFLHAPVGDGTYTASFTVSNPSSVPGYFGAAPDQAGKPQHVTSELKVAFPVSTLDNNTAFVYSRYGNERNDVRLDGNLLAQTDGYDNMNTVYYMPVTLAPGGHTFTITYEGTAPQDGNYMDAVGLLNCSGVPPPLASPPIFITNGSSIQKITSNTVQSVRTKMNGTKDTRDVVVDHAAQKIYWSEHDVQANVYRIRSVAYDGTSPQTLHETSGIISDIAIDTVSSPKQLFWTEDIGANGSYDVKRMRTDGSNIGTIATNQMDVTSIAFDAGRQEVFWLKFDAANDAHVITRAQYSGLSPTTFAEEFSDPGQMGFHNDFLYVLNYESARQSTRFLRLDRNGGARTLLYTEPAEVLDIAIDRTASKFYWISDESNVTVRRIALTGGSTEDSENVIIGLPVVPTSLSLGIQP